MVGVPRGFTQGNVKVCGVSEDVPGCCVQKGTMDPGVFTCQHVFASYQEAPFRLQVWNRHILYSQQKLCEINALIKIINTTAHFSLTPLTVRLCNQVPEAGPFVS